MAGPWEDYQSLGNEDGPWADYASMDRAPMGTPEGNVDTGVGEALLRGAAQAATLNYADELTGGLEAGLDTLTKDDATIGNFLDRYRKARDESRAEYKANEEDHPIASFIGNLGGGVPLAMATAGTGLAAGGLTGAIEAGMGAGALGGLGSSEADVTKGEMDSAAKDAVIGGALGGALGGTIHVGMDKFGDTLAKAGVKAADLAKSAKNAALDIEPLQDLISSFKQGYGNGKVGRRLVGKQAELDLKDESIAFEKKLQKDLQDDISASMKKQDELISNADDIPVGDWYDRVSSALSSVDEKFGANPEVAAEADRMRQEIDNWVLGRQKDLEVQKIEKVPVPIKDHLQKLFDKVSKLNAQTEVKQQLTKEALNSGERTYTAAGNITDDVIPNQFDNETPISILSKDGKLVKAAPIQEIRDDTGNVVGFKGLQQDTADILETAQRHLNEQFANSDLPFEARIFDSKSMGPVVQVVDKSSSVPKPVGKPISLEELTKPQEFITKETTEKVPVRIGGAQGEDRTLPADVALRLKRRLGKMGSQGDKPLKTEVLSVANRALSSPTRDLNMVEGSLGLGEEFTPLKELMEQHVNGLADVDQRISKVLKAQEMAPNLNQILSAEAPGRSATTARKTVQEFLGELPEDLKNKFEPEIQDIGEARHIRDKIAAPGLGSDFWEIIGGTVKGVYYGGGNIAGVMTRTLTPDVVKQIASKTARLGGEHAAAVTRVLTEAAGRDQVGRNALLFALQQNPTYRDVLRQAAGYEPENQSK